MRVLRALGAILLGLILTYGIWLLATPDADGGRSAVGRLAVGLVAFIVVFVIALYAVIRLRGRRVPPRVARDVPGARDRLRRS
jgi:hypothetical protein